MRTKVELLFLLFFVSGFSGLIYESVWSHHVKLFLGHASYAQTLVLVVFIGGLALGAWLVSRASGRMRNPLRLYAMVEALTGILGLVFHWIFGVAIEWGYATLLPASCQQESAFCAAQWGLSALLLAPQSILLGMTFPLMSSAVLRLSNTQPGHDIASLYFLNSLGAVLGVLASAFLLIPSVGLPGTLQTAGFANIVLAVLAYFLSKQAPPPIAIPQVAQPVTAHPREARRLTGVLLLTAFLTGLSSFIYEIVWIRMLSLVLGASTHAFELMLATFILGLALGGLWVRKAVDDVGDSVRFLALVQIVMGISAAATIPLYNGAFDLMAWMLSSTSRSDGGFVLFNLTSTAIALLVMLPATFCAGMTLPLITYRLLRSESGERSLGLVYAVNTVGAIAGVILTVHLLMSWLGLQGALVVGAAVDVLLGAALLVWLRPSRRALSDLGPALAGIVALVFVAAVFDIDERRTASGVFRTGVARINPNSQVLFHEDGKTATVDVVDSEGFRVIRTNGKSDASMSMSDTKNPSRDEFTMALLGTLPLGHRPDAKTAAIIGFGSGMSTAAMLSSPRLERVDTIEIEPAMIRGAQLFRPYVNAAFDDPRSRIVIDDAKSFFARGGARYDIIVSEPSNPWVSGVASLFTEEFYKRLATYLNEGGVLSQWLHTYEMDMQTLAAILSAVSKTFPEFAIYSSIDSDIILIARKGGAPGRFDESVLQNPKLQPLLSKLKLQDPALIHRRVVAHWGAVRPFVSTYGFIPNSDYYPVVDQRASKTRFTQARADELTVLQAAPVPLLEMFEPALRPLDKRLETPAITFVEHALADAWMTHDILLANGKAVLQPAASSSEMLARLVRTWASECPADLSFERILPVVSVIAERMNPRLPPADAVEVWKWLVTSKCARTLKPEQLQWIELFAAVGIRDPQRMAIAGTAILDRSQGVRDESTEYAVVASAAGLLCIGEKERAQKLLDSAYLHWLRGTNRQVEIRYLQSQAARPAAKCPAAG
ncbi:MAG TPA: fused MFS/spermidine synthase [Usitatibacter sp.]|nr:fused MFS/spermidine synthase [Usitatibacter sp.]